ncbi:MAG: FtsQ-type POTRA domain-containing protein [Bacteroidota bacterium]|nr:FtsQ-type POTRA domain-containing protein [Bacteroidota bacterium]
MTMLQTEEQHSTIRSDSSERKLDPSLIELPKNGHGKSVYAVLAVMIVVSVFVLAMAFVWRDHLMTRTVLVRGEQILTEKQVIELANIPPHIGLYDIDLTEIEQNIRRNAFVENVVVKRDAPSALRIIVEERKPIALLTTASGNMFFVDDKGMILPHIATTAAFDLPVITGADSTSAVIVGRLATDGDILAALDALSAARAVGRDVFHLISEIRVRHGYHDLVLYSSDAGVPIIFGKGNAVKKMAELDVFWKQVVVQEGPQNIRYIDLRFDDQIVVSSVPQKLS